MLVPGVAILTTVALFNFLGDSFRDALDPKGGYMMLLKVENLNINLKR